MKHVFARSRFSTGLIDDARERLRRAYGSVEITGALRHYDEVRVGDDRFSLSRAHLDGSFVGTVEMDTVVIASGSGDYAWVDGRDIGCLDFSPVLFQPGRPVKRDVGTVEARVLSLDLAELTRVARLLYADDSLEVRFDSGYPVSFSAGEVWRSLVMSATAMKEQFENDLVRAAVYRQLAVGAVELFRFSGDMTTRHVSAAQRLDAYRTAARFLDDHASLPITLEDAAEAAHVSSAELDLAFHAHSLNGDGVAAYLRRTRLAAAHADLVDGDPTRGDTVKGIALRWGFTHAGRFSQLYRQEYGSSPKWVLDR